MNKRIKKCIVIFFLTIGIIGIVGFGTQYAEKSREAVQIVSEKVLIPGGQSVGIKMDVKGVLIVGLEEIETKNDVISPGYEAGLQIGDIIVSINGTPVYYAEDVSDIVNEEKNALEIIVLRKNQQLKYNVSPIKSFEDGNYKLGIWVKEKIAGIGTLTFYDPETNVYAALGHGIYESQTNTLLEVAKGQLLPTEVKSIKEGVAGKPGEIRGIFYGDDIPLGEVKKNCILGVYSKGTNYKNIELAQPMVMAAQNQIKEGPAHILTTINGSKVEKFCINIVKINNQQKPDGKSMEIQVTDERLLSYSGGIVQGMSGSPIIQDNRIVGAVTHVFVNNPTKGYGIFAEWMVEEGKKIA